MKTSLKKAASIILCVIMICGCVLSVGAQGKVKVNLFGKDVAFPEGYGAPFIDASTSRTLVPARGVFEAMKAEVSWDGTTRTVYIYKGEDKIQIVIDSLTAKKNGEEIMGSPAMPLKDYLRMSVYTKNIEKLVKRVEALEKQLKEKQQ